ncbi:Ig-like domain-containing protein [Paenibacillus flagellatus]|uniref:SLH domain-containing protein n=1 Tax=Paenibacillus flagellatus TaxID=2211139 RepID=A0A2V5KAB6_9BACL|nr:Ig-like domain-containing protein [Paenibacillus flagellatus]PYI56511.1 hypothetical protein DLM86_05945 [Paenibacillus flagellatus]
MRKGISIVVVVVCMLFGSAWAGTNRAFADVTNPEIWNYDPTYEPPWFNSPPFFVGVAPNNSLETLFLKFDITGFSNPTGKHIELEIPVGQPQGTGHIANLWKYSGNWQPTATPVTKADLANYENASNRKDAVVFSNTPLVFDVTAYVTSKLGTGSVMFMLTGKEIFGNTSGSDVIEVFELKQGTTPRLYLADGTPFVTTGAPPASITGSGATLAGDVTGDGGAAVTERGVVVSTSVNPTTGSPLKATASGTTGPFTANVAGLQPNTTYHYRAYAINAKGTAYGEDKQFTTLDASVAVPTNLDLAAVSDSGSSDTDNVTKVTKPTITGKSDPNATIQLFDNALPIAGAAAVANGSGDWTITLASDLPDGTYAITAKATTGDGVSEASSPLVVKIDTTPPVKPGKPDMTASSDSGGSDSDNITKITTPAFGGTTEPDATVKLFADAAEIGGAGADSGGGWNATASAPLPDGTHAITVKAVDAAGNESVSSDPLSITIDTSAPAAPDALDLEADSDSGDSDADNLTYVTTPAIAGTAEPDSTVRLYAGGTEVGSGTATGSGSWSMTASSLGEGAHTFTAKAEDAAGNVGPASSPLVVTIDTTPPAKPGTPDLTPESDTGASNTDNMTKASALTFKGTALAGEAVKLFSGSFELGGANADGSGDWTIPANPAILSVDGLYQIVAKVKDAAGNEAESDALSLHVDRTAPSAPAVPDLTTASDSGKSSTDNVTKVVNPVFSGSAEADSTVRLYDGSTEIGSGTAAQFGTGLTSAVALSDGVRSITATAEDAAGNVGDASGPLAITIDTVPPGAPAGLDLTPASDKGIFDDDNVTSVTTPTITGTAEPDSTVRLYDGMTEVGSATAGSGGDWSVTTSALADGTHALAALAEDAAGNVGAASAGIAVFIVTATPTIHAPSDLTIDENGSTGPLSFTVGDANTAAGELLVRASSDNPDLLPESGIVLSTVSGGNRTIDVTPAAGQDGTVTVTLTVYSLTSESSDSFTVTVNDIPELSPIADQEIATDGSTGELAFTVSDKTTPAALLQVSGTSSNPTLVPDANIVFGGSGANRTVTVTPAAGKYGTATVTIAVDDERQARASRSFTVSVGNAKPVASSGSLAVTEDTPKTGMLNATDANGDALIYSIVTQGTKGTAVVTNPATGEFLYTPNADANGTDSFTFKANDGVADSITATVTVTIAPVNDAPVAAGAVYSTTGSYPLTGALTATDAEGDVLTYRIESQGSKGTVTQGVYGSGTFVYTPIPGATGTDSFTFTAYDGIAYSAPAVVTVEIVPAGVADLAGLSVSTGDLTPAFSANTLAYAQQVASGVGSTTVTATVYEPNASIRINDVLTGSGSPSAPIALTAGTNVIRVEVVAQDAATRKAYTITIVKPSAESRLSGLGLNAGTLTPAFSGDTTSYAASVPNDVSQLTVTATALAPGAAIRINGMPVTGGTPSHPIALTVGPNTIEVEVTAQDGIAKTTYTLTVTRLEEESTPSSEPSSPSAPAAPSGTTRQVNVVVGGADSVAAKVDITRTREQDGTKVDVVSFDPRKAAESVGKAVEAGRDTAKIVIDDLPNDPADAVTVNVPKDSVSAMTSKSINLEIQTQDVKITLPSDTLSLLQADGKDLYFRIVPINKPAEREQVEERTVRAEEVKEAAQNRSVEIVGKPMTIETNYTSRPTKVEFPLKGVPIPTDPQRREAWLAQLAVYIEHSDGDKSLQRGTITYDENGMPVGIEIAISKFSTFTIVRMDGDVWRERYIFGYEDRTFQPEKPITRAEIAAILARNLKGAPSSAASAASGYPDVPAGHWASSAIAALQTAGIMTGDDQGRFRPEQPVTRAETATIVAAWKRIGTAGRIPGYDDAKSHWAASSIAAVQAEGWMTGYEDGTFRPDRPLTRAEAVKVLNRLFDRPALDGIERPTWPDVPLAHWASADVEAASNTYTAQPLPNGKERMIEKK